jgi:hypothetical protein
MTSNLFLNLCMAQQPAFPAQPPAPANPPAGAAIGAIAGDPGEAAAIGATGGVKKGWHEGRKANKQAQAQQQQAHAQAQQQVDAQAQGEPFDRKNTYNKAFSAWVEGKGYTVKWSMMVSEQSAP